MEFWKGEEESKYHRIALGGRILRAKEDKGQRSWRDGHMWKEDQAEGGSYILER